MTMLTCPRCAARFHDSARFEQPIRCPVCSTEIRPAVDLLGLRELQREFAGRDSLIAARRDGGDLAFIDRR